MATGPVHLAARLEHGVLEVQQAKIHYEGGALDFDLRVDASAATPELRLVANVSGVDTSKLISQFEKDTEAAGRLDGAVDLATRGRSPRELVAGLSGRLRATLRDATLADRYGQRFLKDLTAVAIPGLRTTATRLGCIALTLDIEDGVATVDELLLDGRSVFVTGTGVVDLAGDRYALRLVPHPKSARLLSVAATVDVTGPLASPEFSPLPMSIATSAGRALLQNVWRPVGAMLQSPSGYSPASTDCTPDVASR